MYTCLSLEAIGIRMALPEAIKLAAEAGFEGLEFDISEAADLADRHGATYVKELFVASGIHIGNWGFPVEFRHDDATYQADMAGLPRLARVAQQLGATRCATWMLPFSDELRFVNHFDLMVKRLRPAAQILADYAPRPQVWLYLDDGRNAGVVWRDRDGQRGVAVRQLSLVHGARHGARHRQPA
jgi:sugar phosphate isomerase/epimerase